MKQPSPSLDACSARRSKSVGGPELDGTPRARGMNGSRSSGRSCADQPQPDLRSRRRPGGRHAGRRNLAHACAAHLPKRRRFGPGVRRDPEARPGPLGLRRSDLRASPDRFDATARPHRRLLLMQEESLGGSPRSARRIGPGRRGGARAGGRGRAAPVQRGGAGRHDAAGRHRAPRRVGSRVAESGHPRGAPSHGQTRKTT